MASPWYFTLLEIDATDDVRVIRRAYATALKRIDQETQQDDFARLRRAYELAQRWQRDDDEQTAPDQAAAQAEPAPVQAGAQHGAALDPAGNDRHNGFALTPVPVLLGGAANQQTGAGASDNVHAERPRNLKDTAELFQAFAVLVLAKPDAADVLLREALADDALISLAARAEFEREVAQWLSCHRYPHAPLLEASVGEFGWDDRLPTLAAPVALWLRHVIDERSIYLAKAEPWRAHVHQAIDLAAQTKVAVPRDQLVACLEALDGAARHCPDWLALHLLPEQTRSWLALAAKAAQPTRWEVFHSTLRARLRESKIGWLALVVLVCIVGTRMLPQEDGRSPGANPPPAFSRPLTSFKVNPALCAARARLGGRWAQLYDNELTYRSFKAEVTDCLDANLWPGGQTSADDYLQRLKHAWRNASDPDNASLVGCCTLPPSLSIEIFSMQLTFPWILLLGLGTVAGLILGHALGRARTLAQIRRKQAKDAASPRLLSYEPAIDEAQLRQLAGPADADAAVASPVTHRAEPAGAAEGARRTPPAPAADSASIAPAAKTERAVRVERAVEAARAARAERAAKVADAAKAAEPAAAAAAQPSVLAPTTEVEATPPTSTPDFRSFNAHSLPGIAYVGKSLQPKLAFEPLHDAPVGLRVKFAHDANDLLGSLERLLRPTAAWRLELSDATPETSKQAALANHHPKQADASSDGSELDEARSGTEDMADILQARLIRQPNDLALLEQLGRLWLERANACTDEFERARMLDMSIVHLGRLAATLIDSAVPQALLSQAGHHRVLLGPALDLMLLEMSEKASRRALQLGISKDYRVAQTLHELLMIPVPNQSRENAMKRLEDARALAVQSLSAQDTDAPMWREALLRNQMMLVQYECRNITARRLRYRELYAAHAAAMQDETAPGVLAAWVELLCAMARLHTGDAAKARYGEAAQALEKLRQHDAEGHIHASALAGFVLERVNDPSHEGTLEMILQAEAAVLTHVERHPRLRLQAAQLTMAQARLATLSQVASLCSQVLSWAAPLTSSPSLMLPALRVVIAALLMSDEPKDAKERHVYARCLDVIVAPDDAESLSLLAEVAFRERQFADGCRLCARAWRAGGSLPPALLDAWQSGSAHWAGITPLAADFAENRGDLRMAWASRGSARVAESAAS